VVARSEVAAEHDMTVKQGADGVRDGIVHVVALDEHGVEGGDATARGEIAGPLQQPGQEGKDRRRVALG